MAGGDTSEQAHVDGEQNGQRFCRAQVFGIDGGNASAVQTIAFYLSGLHT